jgi:hypothetical protein
MQLDGKHEYKKHTYHLVLILELLSSYMFQHEFVATKREVTKT